MKRYTPYPEAEGNVISVVMREDKHGKWIDRDELAQVLGIELELAYGDECEFNTIRKLREVLLK